MARTKPPYPAQFRKQVVELARAGRTAAQLAREFGCSAQTVTNWVAQATLEARIATGPPLTASEREELELLRQRVRQLQEERDLLAKAAAWFAAQGERRVLEVMPAS